MAWRLIKGLNCWEIWDEKEKQEDRSLPFLSHRMAVPASFDSLTDLEAWLNETEKKQAKNYALRLLAGQNYPSKIFCRKLLRKGYRDNVIEEILNWVQHLNLVQDDEYLHHAIQHECGKGHGPKAIVWKLRMKGFTDEAIEKELAEIMPIEIQKESIQKFLLKHPLKGPFAKQKTIAALMRRGFSTHVINDVLRDIH